MKKNKVMINLSLIEGIYKAFKTDKRIISMEYKDFIVLRDKAGGVLKK